MAAFGELAGTLAVLVLLAVVVMELLMAVIVVVGELLLGALEVVLVPVPVVAKEGESMVRM